jgi:pentatricopeptide repeat protein
MSDRNRYLELATESIRDGRPEKAARVLRNARQLYPDDGQIAHLLVTTLLRVGDWEAAAEIGGEASETLGGDWLARVQRTRATALVMAGRYDEALEIYDRLLAMGHLPAPLQRDKIAHRAEGLREGHGASIRRADFEALSLRPPPLQSDGSGPAGPGSDDPDRSDDIESLRDRRLENLVDRARELGLGGKPDLAVGQLELALRLAPDNDWLRARLMEVFLAMGDVGSAADTAEQAYRLGAGELPELLGFHADALVMDTRPAFDDAAEVYRRAAEGSSSPDREEYRRRMRMLPQDGPALRTELWRAQGHEEPQPWRIPPIEPEGLNYRRRHQQRLPGMYESPARRFRSGEPTRRDVFLSYRSVDSDLARALAEQLELLDVTVWFAENVILEANYEAFHDHVLEGIDGCAAAICLESPGYWKSAHCEQEAIWLAQRFGDDPDRLIQVQLARPRDPVDPWPLDAPAIEGEPQWQDEVIRRLGAALQRPGLRTPPRHQPGLPNPCTTGAPQVRFDAYDLAERRRERHPFDGTELVELASANARLTVDFDWSFPEELLGGDIVNDEDDRRVYRLQRRLAARFVNSLVGVDLPIEYHGLHLIWHEGRTHAGFTLRMGDAWHRVVALQLRDASADQRVTMLLAFSVVGDREAFLEHLTVFEGVLASVELQGSIEPPAWEVGALTLHKRPLAVLEVATSGSPSVDQADHMLVAGYIEAARFPRAAEVGTLVLTRPQPVRKWAGRLQRALADAFVMIGDWDRALAALHEVRPLLDQDPLLGTAQTIRVTLCLEQGYGHAVRDLWFEAQGLAPPPLPASCGRPRPLTKLDKERIERQVQAETQEETQPRSPTPAPAPSAPPHSDEVMARMQRATCALVATVLLLPCAIAVIRSVLGPLLEDPSRTWFGGTLVLGGAIIAYQRIWTTLVFRKLYHRLAPAVLLGALVGLGLIAAGGWLLL